MEGSTAGCQVHIVEAIVPVPAGQSAPLDNPKNNLQVAKAAAPLQGPPQVLKIICNPQPPTRYHLCIQKEKRTLDCA